MFVGREDELATLEGLYGRPGFQMVVIYGRRRVGKTTLIDEVGALETLEHRSHLVPPLRSVQNRTYLLASKREPGEALRRRAQDQGNVILAPTTDLYREVQST